MHQLQEEGVWGELLQIDKHIQTSVIRLLLIFTVAFQPQISLTVFPSLDRLNLVF